MGRLNFSIIDSRAVNVYQQERFGGGPSQFDWHLKNLQKRKVPHTISTKGSVGIITANGVSYRYSLKEKVEKKEGETEFEFNVRKEKGQSEVMKTLRCCKAVRDDVDRFLKKNKPLVHGRGELVFISQAATSFFVNGGGRDVALVDIKRCYWTILRNFGIISEKTFEDYKDERDARLVSVGCLKRAEHIKYHSGEKIERNETLKTKYEWVWDFVVYKTYMAIKTVCDSVSWRVFSYITDGIYLPEKNAEEAVKILSELGFTSVVKRYTIIGYMGHWMVLENKETGAWKRANLGMSSGIKESLKQISEAEFKAKSGDGAEADNQFKTGNTSAMARAEVEFLRFNGYLEEAIEL